MTKKESQLLNQIHGTVKQTAEDIDWIKNGIRVNGSSGVENILKEQHNFQIEQQTAIQELKPKVHEVYEVTNKLRSRFKFIRALKDFVNERPVLKKLSETLIGKVVTQIVAWLFWITVTLAGLNLALNTIKNAAGMLVN